MVERQGSVTGKLVCLPVRLLTISAAVGSCRAAFTTVGADVATFVGRTNLVRHARSERRKGMLVCGV